MSRQPIFFHKTEVPTRVQDLPDRFYTGLIDKEMRKAFFDLNGLGGKREMVYPGRMVFVPSAQGLAAGPPATLTPALRQLNQADFAGNDRLAVNVFNGDFELVEFVSRHDKGLQGAERFLDGTSEYLENRLKGVTKSLKSLGMAYADDLKGGGGLRSPGFMSARTFIEHDLDRQMTGFSRKAILQNAHRTPMKAALGISHKSILHEFKTSGHPTEVKAITKALKRTEGLSAKIARLGKVAKVIGYVRSGEKIYSAFASGDARQGWKAVAHEGGGIAGGLAGGAIGGLAGTALVAILGVGTGGVGFIAGGVILVGGRMIGSAIGEDWGEKHADQWFDADSEKWMEAGDHVVEWVRVRLDAH